MRSLQREVIGFGLAAMAWMESGRVQSLATLRKYAKATGSKIEIKLFKAV